MQPEPVCRRCGAALPPDGAPCPRCLLELGVAAPPPADDEPATSAPSVRMVPPGIDELRGLFPDLEFESLIGHGGMGAVFRARQKKLQRDVALKVLPRELSADRAFADRFLREARALARLSHPNIVAVHDYGETGGICWLMLEYVDGVNLRGVLRAGSLSPRQALAIVRELCDALQYAHDEGVVHRDIKPENVLVDRRGRAKVADFGLAKLVGAPADADLTREGQVMGTPHYMAPEQIERPRDVDHRADIYALGVVFYEMLTGSLPRGNFEPPSRRVQVDVRLDEIVLKALEHEPSRRYQHAVDVKTDVDAVGDGAHRVTQPSVAGAPSEEIEGFGVHAEVGAPGMHVRELRWPRARDAAAERKHGALLRGWRGFVLVLVAWIALGASWNLGPFAFGLASVVALLVVALLVQARIVAHRDLAAALAAESPRRRSARVFLAAAIGLVGLGLVALGHVAHWESGVHGWVPAWRGTEAQIERLRENVWSLMPADSATAPNVEPRLVVSHAAVSGSVGENLPVSGLVIILIGLIVLASAVHAAVRMTGRPDLGRASRAIALELGGQIGLGLMLLWIGAPIGALRPHASLDAVTSNTRIDAPFDEVLRRLRTACVRGGLAVDVVQVAKVADVRTAEPYSDVLVLRCAAGSPFERWSTTWSGAARRTPQVWISAVQPRGSTSTEVRMNAGLYPPASPEARAASQLLAEIEQWSSTQR